MVNVGTYPKELDGDGHAENAGIQEIIEHLKASFILAFRNPELRSLIESMSFEVLQGNEGLPATNLKNGGNSASSNTLPLI